MSDTQQSGERQTYNDFVFQCLLNEVHLLMDFVSGRPEKSLACLDRIPIPGGAKNPADITAADVIAHICKVRYGLRQSETEKAEDTAFLMQVKDELNRKAAPAVGSTIAFTTMTVGLDQPEGERQSSRVGLARKAYPDLIVAARKQRWFNNMGFLFVLFLTLATAYSSFVVTFGRTLLAGIEDTAALRDRVADQIRSAEAGLKSDKSFGPVYGLCDLSKVAGWQQQVESSDPPQSSGQAPAAQSAPRGFANAAERTLCAQLGDAETRRNIAYQNLYSFKRGFLFPYELPFDVLTRVQTAVVARLFPRPASFGADAAMSATDAVNYERNERQARDNPGEHWIAAMLAGIGNYVLPLLFTLLGAAVSIGRDLYTKMRMSQLDPRDRPLAWGRLALGLVAGAAIGLFFSPTPTVTNDGAHAGQVVPITASGLAFLAGYGVDTVFAVFDALLTRMTKQAQSDAGMSVAARPVPA